MKTYWIAVEAKDNESRVAQGLTDY